MESSETDTIQNIVMGQNLQNNDWWKCIKELLGDPDKKDSPLYPLFESLDDLLKDGAGSFDDNKMRLFAEYFADLKKCWTAKVEDMEWQFDKCFEKLIGRKVNIPSMTGLLPLTRRLINCGEICQPEI